MKKLIVDTGVWYACFDPYDNFHWAAEKILRVLEQHELIVPFPTLYETLDTRFAKNHYRQVDSLFLYLNKSNKVHLVDDAPYKHQALSVMQSNALRKKAYSLVDMVIRLMMEDKSLGAIAVLTFNVNDFAGAGNVEIVDAKYL